MKFIVTQKKIFKIILFSIIIFGALLINTLISSWFPPLIKKVYIEKDFGEYQQITLEGRFPSADTTNQIIVNNKAIPKSDILTWKKNTISYVTSHTENNLDTIQIQTQQIFSNKKFLLKNIPSNTTETLLEDETQYIDTYTIPTLQTTTPLLPHAPIVFSTTTDMQRVFFINQKQGGGIVRNKTRTEIPLYRTYYDGAQIYLFPNESLWFHQTSQASIDIEENDRIYSYDISFQNIFENASYVSYAYTIDITIPQSKTDRWVFLPYTTTYQYTTFLDTTLAMQYKNFTDSIYALGDTQYISLKTNILVGKNNLVNPTPVFYNQERSLSYLFQNISAEDRIAIQTILASSVDTTLQNIAITHMKLPPIFNTAQVKNIYSIQSELDTPIPTNIDVKTLHAFLNEYILKLYMLGKEQPTEILTQLDYMIPILQYETLQKNTIADIYHNLMSALLMRTNNIVARTMVGIDVTNTLSRLAKQQDIQYISWVEIFTKEHGWVAVQDGILSERNNNQIGFFIAEVFINTFKHSQNPQIPDITNITLVHK